MLDIRCAATKHTTNPMYDRNKSLQIAHTRMYAELWIYKCFSMFGICIATVFTKS